MAIDVSDVVSEYGSYYIDHGQNQNDLIQKLHRPSVTANEFMLRPTTETQLRKGTSALTRVLQPFQKVFSALGSLEFKANPIDLFHMKINVKEYPDDIADTWLGFLEGPGIDREAWPFVRWLIEVHIINQVQEDFELNEVWAGEYLAPPTPGTAGALGTAMDGIKKLLTDNTALVNGINNGAIPADPADFVTYLEEWYGQIDKEYRKRIQKVYLNEDLELRFKMGMDAKYNTNYAQQSDILGLKYFPQAKVMGLPSMGTDETIWATLPQNMLRPVKKTEFSNIKVKEYEAYAVSIMTDWWTVCSFARWESIYTNDL